MEFRVSSSDLRFNRRWCFSNIKVRMVSGFNRERRKEIVFLPPEKTRSTATTESGEVKNKSSRQCQQFVKETRCAKRRELMRRGAIGDRTPRRHGFFQKTPGLATLMSYQKVNIMSLKKSKRITDFPPTVSNEKVQVSQPSGMGLGPALASKYLAPKEFPDGGNHRDFSSRARDTSAPSPEISKIGPLQGDLRSAYVPYTAVTIRVHTVPFTAATVTVRWATGGLTVRYTDPYNP
ncbi:hypothetical protein B0H17DRAFT_1146984 [Mycena rosella]|uniref:Uncharacterized protein n=1 Tax=Mycena rosella TaxID=1033263 RepID=A0AAD7CMT2_MYCRO|nr:hypothetical protein B0H17DRAFT_1146984 [Mycena rosella]